MHGLVEGLGALQYLMAVDSSCIMFACCFARSLSLADEREADGSSLAVRSADRRASLVECVIFGVMFALIRLEERVALVTGP